METACSGIRQKTGRRPAIARVFLPQSGKIAANYKKNDDPSMERAKTNGPIRGISRRPVRSVRSVRPETEETEGGDGGDAEDGGDGGDGGDDGDDGAGSRSGCCTGRVRKKKNVRPCSRTFRCSSLSLSVSWRRDRLSNLHIQEIS